MDLSLLGWNGELARSMKEVPGKGVVPGRIVRHDRKRFLIRFEKGEFAAPAAGRLAFRAGEEYPVVGDWVAAHVNRSKKSARITHLLPRFSKISRRAPGQVNREQVLAANIDVIFLVSGLDHDFNPRRIERALAMVWDSGARPVLVLNKKDASPDSAADLEEVRSLYPAIPVHLLSALESGDVDQLREHVGKGVTATFMGSSGVGKSTIVNRLLGYEHMKTAEVRELDSKGRHTTTHRELILLEQGGALIDTPGIRELQLWGDPDKILGAFPDIVDLSRGCRFRDCRHENEPECAVQEALEREELDHERFMNFIKLREEMEELAREIRETGKEDGGRELKRHSRSFRNESKYSHDSS